MFVFGGSLSSCGFMSKTTWVFNFATATWEKRNPRGPIPRAEPGIIAVYDATSQTVFVHDSTTLYSYDFDADKYTTLSSGSGIDYHMTGIVDPVRRKLVLVGAGNVYVYDISPRSGHARRTVKTTGGEAIVNSASPGLSYDPISGHIVAWNGGDSVYSLNLDVGRWTVTTFPGGPGKAPRAGTFKRWSYSPGSGAFILVNSMDSNAYSFRLVPNVPAAPPRPAAK
jgi:hypothetical protein